MKDFELVRGRSGWKTGILVSCSDYHIFYKLKMNRRGKLWIITFHCKECMGCRSETEMPSGRILRIRYLWIHVPFSGVMKLMERSIRYRLRSRVYDTMGYKLSTGGSIQRSRTEIIYGLMTHAGVWRELIEFHGHNDFYKAVNNSTTAWLYSAHAGSELFLFGIGERTEILRLKLGKYLNTHSSEEGRWMEWIQSGSWRSTMKGDRIRVPSERRLSGRILM